MERMDLTTQPKEKLSKKPESEREKLSDQDLQERDEVVKKLGNAMEQWRKDHIPEGEAYDRNRVAELVRYLSAEHRDDINRITGLFHDREKYVGRPAVRIFESADDTQPDVWLLGWRRNEEDVEETDIHDHGASEAAFHVHQGNVNEAIYAFDKKQWQEKIVTLDFQIATRGLHEGSTATIGSPYIHIVTGERSHDLSVTIHGYYPPLNHMNIYEETSDGLLRVDEWKKSGKGQEGHC